MSEVKTLANNDYNSWRNRLIAIVNKHGYTVDRIPNWTGTTVSVGENMTNQQMSNISKDMIQSSITLCHIPAFSTLDIGDYSVGKPTLLTTKTKIEAKLAEMEAVCHHYANYANKSSDYTGDKSYHYSGDCDCGDCGDCDCSGDYGNQSTYSSVKGANLSTYSSVNYSHDSGDLSATSDCSHLGTFRGNYRN